MADIIIAYDPASNSSGVAVFDFEGNLISSINLKAKPTLTLLVRLKNLHTQFLQFVAGLNIRDSDTVHLVIEDVFKMRNQSAALAASAAIPIFLPKVETLTFVSPSSWKAWAVRHGCSAKPKGAKSLAEIKPDLNIKQDDVADACFLGLYHVSCLKEARKPARSKGNKK